MSVIPRPKFNITDVLNEAKSNIRCTTIRNLEQSDLGNIKSDSKTYVNFASKLDLNKMQQSSFCPKSTPAKNLYKSLLGKSGCVCNKFRSELLNGANFCYLCGADLRTDPGQLDHFLSKEKYNSLCITPENLVPMCYNCNQEKSETKNNMVFLHPYFEDIDPSWIEATVVSNPEFRVAFSLIYQNNVTNNQSFNNYKNGVLTLNLLEKYSNRGTFWVMDNIINPYKDYYKDSDETPTSEQIIREIRSRRSLDQELLWQNKAIDACIESTWFCNAKWLR